MTDAAPFNSPAEATGGKAPGLSTRVGSFPLGVWLLIAAAGIGIGLIIRRFTSGLSGSSSAADSGTVGAAPADYSTQGAAFASPGTVGLPGGTGNPLPTTEVEPETNLTWVKKAIARLGVLGYDAADADAALRKYVNGEALTQAEKTMVSVAIASLGPPPEEVPSIIVATPEAPTAPAAPAPPPPTPVPQVPAPISAEEQNRQAWLAEAQRLKDLANSGQPMSDADLDKMRGMGFTTSDESLSATFRFYWRIWLNARGYQHSNG